MAEPFVGEIRLFSFGVIPRGWVPCQGQVMPVSQNQALFSILGNRYGGDGRTTFMLPDLRGRVPLQVSQNHQLASAGGESTHVLTTEEIPPHTHQVSGSQASANQASPSNNVWANTGTNTIYADSANTTLSPNAIATAGTNQGHNNMQPYQVVSFCIATQGIYPSKS